MGSRNAYSPVDVEIEEPLGTRNRMKPELIILAVYATISSLSLGTTRWRLSDICHTFHRCRLKGMLNRTENTLNLIGNVKTFRIAEIKYRSYLITDPGQCHHRPSWKWIDQEANIPLNKIKLLHFSTHPSTKPTTHTCSRYGSLQFTTTYEDATKEYLKARNRHCTKKPEYKRIAFRVGFTQIFTKEINKTVLICCEEDVDLEEFPKLGAEHYSKYFTPYSDGSAQIGLEQYEDDRHDELSLAFYLPDNCYMTFPLPKDGHIPRVDHDPTKCHEIFKTPYFTGRCPDIEEYERQNAQMCSMQ